MKISYKKIKTIRKRPAIVDNYYDLRLSDFFSDEEIEEIEHDKIYRKLKRAQERKQSNG